VESLWNGETFPPNAFANLVEKNFIKKLICSCRLNLFYFLAVSEMPIFLVLENIDNQLINKFVNL